MSVHVLRFRPRSPGRFRGGAPSVAALHSGFLRFGLFAAVNGLPQLEFGSFHGRRIASSDGINPEGYRRPVPDDAFVRWQSSEVEYLSLSIGGTTSFLANYEGWGSLLLTSLGWAITPFCGILTSFLVLKSSLTESATHATGQILAFVVVSVIALVIVLVQQRVSVSPTACDVDLLKALLCNGSRARSEYLSANDNTDGYKKATEENTHPTAYARLLRDTQPWALLPKGYWTKWSDADYEDNKLVLQCLGMYITLIDAQPAPKPEDDIDAVDCLPGDYPTIQERYQRLLDVKSNLQWVLTGFIYRNGELYKSFDGKFQDVSAKSPHSCHFNSLMSKWKNCASCEVESSTYSCESCIYGNRKLLHSSMQFMKGTVLSCVGDAEMLYRQLGDSSLLKHDVNDITEDILQQAIAFLECSLSHFFELVSISRLADEWLLLCTSMQAIVLSLHELIKDHNCNRQPSNGATVATVVSAPTGGSVTSPLTTPVSQTAVQSTSGAHQLTNVLQLPEKRTDIPTCGCTLFTKMLECVLKLHKGQCDVALLMHNGNLALLKDKIPTFCHIRAVSLLISNYEGLMKCRSDNRCKCTAVPSRNCWFCTRYNSALDELLTWIFKDMDFLVNGDQLLYMVVSLVSCAKTTDISKPKTVLHQIKMSSSLLSGLFYRALAFGWRVMDHMPADTSFKFEKQHCDCAHGQNSQCDICVTGACKDPMCQCEKCKNSNGATTDDANECSKLINGFHYGNPCSTYTTNNGTPTLVTTAISCTCVKKSCDNILCGNTWPKALATLRTASSASDGTLNDAFCGISCLMHGICGSLCAFMKATCYPVDSSTTPSPAHSIISNLCNSSAFFDGLTECNKSVPSSNPCCKGNGDVCVNQATCSLMKSIFKKPSENSVTVSQFHCNTDGKAHCIGSFLSKYSDAPKTPSGDQQCCNILKGLGDGVERCSNSVSIISGEMSHISNDVVTIKTTADHIPTMASRINCVYGRLLDASVAFVKCARSKATKLHEYMTRVKKNQENNLSNLQRSCTAIKTNVGMLNVRSGKSVTALTLMEKRLGQNSALMTRIGEYVTELQGHIANSRTIINATRRSAYMASVKNTICRYLCSNKCVGGGVTSGGVFLLSLWIYTLLLLLLFSNCIGIDLLPCFAGLRGTLLYRIIGLLTAMIAPTIVIRGVTYLSKIPQQAGYLVNLAILIGAICAIVLSWFSQGYAYNSYMTEKFTAYSRNYRFMHPDYIDQNSETSRWSEGIRGLVRADYQSISDFWSLSDVIYSNDPYDLGLSPRFCLAPPTLYIQRFWTEARAKRYIKCAALTDAEDDFNMAFDLMSFNSLTKTQLHFLTDIEENNAVPYPVDLLWEGWTSGTLVTKGHNAMYGAKMYALDSLRMKIASQSGSCETKDLETVKRWRSFQKEQLREVAESCIDLAFVPEPPRFSVQQEALTTLLENDYLSLWENFETTDEDKDETDSDVTEDEVGTSIDAVETEVKADTEVLSSVSSNYMIYELDHLLELCQQWKAHKTSQCKVYKNGRRCIKLVSETVDSFKSFVLSCSPGTVYYDPHDVYDAYQRYRTDVAYESSDATNDKTRGDTTKSAQTMYNTSLIGHWDLRSSLDSAFDSPQSLVTLEDGACASQRNHDRSILGEWIRLSGINLRSGILGIMSDEWQPLTADVLLLRLKT
ncbi:sugar ABC transporter substrate-binding protein [Babesia caballi]|uniref:Sugar ABC transporter substrate-binding protein n=1 Tax=Babesia caballi TaxID=5871 RepID=A0AAV4LVU5_BABCB|nr:sugar ABC transporter substrate-binding protein [Babesia caballi]